MSFYNPKNPISGINKLIDNKIPAGNRDAQIVSTPPGKNIIYCKFIGSTQPFPVQVDPSATYSVGQKVVLQRNSTTHKWTVSNVYSDSQLSIVTVSSQSPTTSPSTGTGTLSAPTLHAMTVTNGFVIYISSNDLRTGLQYKITFIDSDGITVLSSVNIAGNSYAGTVMALSGHPAGTNIYATAHSIDDTGAASSESSPVGLSDPLFDVLRMVFTKDFADETIASSATHTFLTADGVHYSLHPSYQIDEVEIRTLDFVSSTVLSGSLQFTAGSTVFIPYADVDLALAPETVLRCHYQNTTSSPVSIYLDGTITNNDTVSHEVMIIIKVSWAGI